MQTIRPFILASILVLETCALLGCAGGIGDLVEPASFDARHPFPVRDLSPGPRHHDIHGIDIAKYQGEIDWAAVKNSGIEFAFIKATEGGDRLDDKFEANWAAAKEAGLPRGAYHFNYWCSSWANQAEWFKRNVPVDPDALPPVLDLEWNNASPTCPRSVPRETALAGIYTFVHAMEKHYKKRPILYTDANFHRDVLSDGALADYPLWVRAVKELPHVQFPGRRWAFWQYTEKAAVPGIRGNVDKNAFAGNRAQWRKLVSTAFHGEPDGKRASNEAAH